MIKLIGKKEYVKKLKILEQLEMKEESNFIASENNIDERPEELKDIPLHPGFKAICGMQGGKLSGG